MARCTLLALVALLCLLQCPFARTQLTQQIFVTHNPDHVGVEIAKTTIVSGETDSQLLCSQGDYYDTRHTFEVLANARDGCGQISIDSPDSALVRNGGEEPALEVTIDPLACRENGARCVFLVTIDARHLSCEELHNSDAHPVVFNVGAHVSEVCPAGHHPSNNGQHHMMMRVEFGYEPAEHPERVHLFRKRQVASTTVPSTDSGSPASSTVSSLTVSPVSSNSTPSVASAQPAPAYSVSIDTSSVSVSSVHVPSTTSEIEEVDIPDEKLFERSSVHPDTIFKDVENSSSTEHIAIEQTEFRHQYVMDHAHRVPSSVISMLETQAEEFSPFSKSDVTKLDEQNFHDDEDSSAVIGGQFAFQNVQCLRSNGSSFAIPNVPCSRVEGHPNLCYPICAQKYQPYCTPQCFCRDNFNTSTYTDAAIINCTKGFFPQPTRGTRVDTWGWIIALVFVPLPLLSPFILQFLFTADKIYDVPMPWDALANALAIRVS